MITIKDCLVAGLKDAKMNKRTRVTSFGLFAYGDYYSARISSELSAKCAFMRNNLTVSEVMLDNLKAPREIATEMFEDL